MNLLQPELTIVPLSDEEVQHLRDVYTTRLRVFCAGYAFLVSAALLQPLGGFGELSDEELHERLKKGIDYEMFGHSLTRLDFFYLIVTLFGGLILCSGIYIYLKKLRPFIKDIKSGMKEAVPFTVIDKKHFPLTSEYFFSFDDPRFLHYEVDESTYYSLSVGNVVYIYRGIHSKHVFEMDGRFTF